VDAIDNEVKRSKRTGREFALLLFDLDNLKKINDRYGHLAGSQTLCRLADVLSMGSRDIDTAARFGGDEFALVLPETDSESANLVSQRICSHFANDGREPKASVSVGIANFPTDGESIETLLSAADVALYKMKTTAHDRDNLGGNSTNLALVDGINANAEAKRPIGSGTERRRHFRLKIVETTSRDSYWVGQPLQVTFPFGSAPTDTNTARQARVVRNIVMPDLRNAIAVQFEDQVGTVGSWVS
jgi:diguanylate cyclase (GGDEF)-like protein